jgi:hypothetical protein
MKNDGVWGGEEGSLGVRGSVGSAVRAAAARPGRRPGFGSPRESRQMILTFQSAKTGQVEAKNLFSENKTKIRGRKLKALLSGVKNRRREQRS